MTNYTSFEELKTSLGAIKEHVRELEHRNKFPDMVTGHDLMLLDLMRAVDFLIDKFSEYPANPAEGLQCSDCHHQGDYTCMNICRDKGCWKAKPAIHHVEVSGEITP